jgi:hypothetical protein
MSAPMPFARSQSALNETWVSDPDREDVRGNKANLCLICRTRQLKDLKFVLPDSFPPAVGPGVQIEPRFPVSAFMTEGHL